MKPICDGQSDANFFSLFDNHEIYQDIGACSKVMPNVPTFILNTKSKSVTLNFKTLHPLARMCFISSPTFLKLMDFMS